MRRPRLFALLPFACAALALPLAACDGCAKKPATTDVPAVASADPAGSSSAAPATDPSAIASAGPGGAKPITAARAAGDGGGSDAAAPVASAAPSGSVVALASAVAAPSASASAAPGKSSYADEIPKPCTDGMGRLGLLTFTDLGGGRVRVSSAKNASASCTRTAPTQYQCDWVIDGKPTGSFTDRFDPAHKSVQGSIAKGQMFTCPPSSQR
jgi:hypothetical protein